MWSDNETSQDLLGFKIHADLLIDLIKDDTLLPITIGVFGDWGSGKSSILKMIQQELEQFKDGTFVLYFNGWIFEGYDDAKAALIETIIRSFDENKKIRSKIKDQIQKLLKSVNWMRMLGFGFKNVILPTASAYFTGGLSLIPFLAQNLSKANPEELIQHLQGKEATEYLRSFVKDKTEETDSILIRKFRDDFEDLIKKSEIKKLVVLIDDLDRCAPDRIIENLEAIKLFLNVPKTAFVIGADPRIVRHAIEYRYKPKVEDSNERIVDDYLEKLIQVPYYLPKLSDSEVETYISLLMSKKHLSEEQFTKVINSFNEFRIKNRYSVYGLSDIKDCLKDGSIDSLTKDLGSIPTLSSIISQSLYGNPRQIKRFLNTYILRKKLADIAKISDFDNSVLVKLMILEYSESILFNKFYEWQVTQEGRSKEIKEIEDICKNNSSEKALSELENSNYKIWKKPKIINLLSTEPFLQNIDLRDYFWIARDKLTSSIPGASLIPPNVKYIFNELKQDITNSIRIKIIEEKASELNISEKNILLSLCAEVLKNDTKNKIMFEIFYCFIDMHFNDADEYFMTALKNISPSELEASEGTSLQKYKTHPVLGDCLSKYFSNSKEPAAIAFNLEE